MFLWKLLKGAGFGSGTKPATTVKGEFFGTVPYQWYGLLFNILLLYKTFVSLSLRDVKNISNQTKFWRHLRVRFKQRFSVESNNTLYLLFKQMFYRYVHETSSLSLTTCFKIRLRSLTKSIVSSFSPGEQ